MPKPPHAASTTETLSTSVYSSLALRASASGKTVYPLHVGDTYRRPPEGAWTQHQTIEAHPRLHNYAPPKGIAELREAISEHLTERARSEIDAESVQVTAGATNGLSVAIQSLVEPGDEVLVLAPFWPLIRGMIAARGAAAVQVPFFTELENDGFSVEGALEAACTERTVAVYVNTPNNPTGIVLSNDAMSAIAAFAKKHNLWILCDEAYENLYLQGDQPRPLWDFADARGRAIAAHTFSKSYALAGARVGYLHGPEAAMRVIGSVQTFQNYSASTPMQLAALAALREGAGWLEEARAAYADAGLALAAAFGVPAPAGGTFLFVDVRRFFQNGEGLLGLLERFADEGVLLTAGHACGEAYPDYVRVCFTSVERSDLDEVISILPRLLRAG